MRPVVATVAAVILFLSAGCGGDRVTGVPTSISGRWAGAASGTSVSMQLTESGIEVSGAGVFTDASGASQISVSGTYHQPAVSLTLQFPNTNFNPVFLSGTASADVITGALNGSGYNNFAITLARQ
jgi:hypothetical protein